MKTSKLLASVVAAVSLLAVTAFAVPISGDLSFNGVANLNGTSFLNATQITSITGVTVLPGSQAGTYTPVPDGLAVTMAAPLDFTSAGAHAPVAIMPTPLTFWSFSSGGLTYSFDLTSIGVAYHDGTILSLYGSGMAHVTGYDDTLSTWTITDTRASGSTAHVTFGHSITVPDAAPTGGLIGLALGAVLLVAQLRSRLSRA